jgi:peptidoglycan/LPS O-acetylase OafA/YrhL
MNKGIQVVMLVLTFLFVFSVIRIPALSDNYYDHFIHAFLFGYLMLMAVSPNSILRLEQPLFKTLGKVSYGIYLFHTPVCQLALIAFMKFFGRSPNILLYEIIYPLTCLVLTCAIAYVSYELFEKHFLKIKSRFAVVQTRL